MRRIRDLHRRQRVSELLAVVNEAPWQSVRYATLALGDLRSPDAVPSLAGCLQHSEVKVRAAAAEALGRISLPSSAATLSDWVSAVPVATLYGRTVLDRWPIMLACRSLGQMRDRGVPTGSSATEALLARYAAWLSDPDPEYQWWYERWIGSLHDPMALEPLVARLDQLRADRKGSARLYLQVAAEALAELGDRRACPPLKALLTTLPNEAAVKIAVATSLARLGDREGADYLVGVARAEGQWSQVAARALASGLEVADPDGLADLLGSADPAVRAYAAIALIRLGRRDLGMPALRAFVEHLDRHSRQATLRLFGVYKAAVEAIGDPLDASPPTRQRLFPPLD